MASLWCILQRSVRTISTQSRNNRRRRCDNRYSFHRSVDNILEPKFMDNKSCQSHSTKAMALSIIMSCLHSPYIHLQRNVMWNQLAALHSSVEEIGRTLHGDIMWEFECAKYKRRC